MLYVCNRHTNISGGTSVTDVLINSWWHCVHIYYSRTELIVWKYKCVCIGMVLNLEWDKLSLYFTGSVHV